MFKWLAANWHWLVPIAVAVVVAVLNKATVVWHEKTGFVKWAQFLISIISFLPSLGRGWLKMPGIPELPPKPAPEPEEPKAEPIAAAPPVVKPPTEDGFVLLRALVLLLGLSALVLLLAGCPSSTLGKLGQLQTSVAGLRQSATVVLDNRCADLIPACPSGGLSKCDSYQKCAAARRIIYATASSLQVSIDAAASLAALSKDDEAKRLLPTITDGLNRLVQQLTYYDVLKAGQTVLGTATPAAPLTTPEGPAAALSNVKGAAKLPSTQPLGGAQ